MCGIAGYSGTKPLNQDKMNFLLYMNSVERGLHSTGTYTVEQGVIKAADTAATFLKSNPVPNTNFFIGHVRHATVGVKNAKNAHPFEFEHLVGVHNGTLKNHWSLLSKAGYKMADYDVDSQVLYQLLNDEAAVENLPEDELRFKTLSKYEGAAALLFTDKRNPRLLYAFRNGARKGEAMSDRPLYYGKIRNGMYISSMESSLNLIGCQDITLFEDNTLYTIQDGVILDKTEYPVYVPVPSYYPRQTQSQTQSKIREQDGVYDEYMEDYYSKRYPKEEAKIKSLPAATPSDRQQKIDNSVDMSFQSNTDLVGKWWKLAFAVKYYDEDVFLTKGSWYYVKSAAASNNYDVVIEADDSGKSVKLNKFMFVKGSAEFKDYARLMFNISHHDDSKNILFNKGDVVEIARSKEGKKDHLLVYCPKDSNSYQIKTEYMRPATMEEFDAFDEAEATSPFHGAASSDLEQTKPEDAAKQEPLTEVTDEVLPKENQLVNVPATVVNYLLDTISDQVSEVKSITKLLNVDVLNDAMSDLETTVQLAYSYEDFMPDTEDEDTPADKSDEEKKEEIPSC